MMWSQVRQGHSCPEPPEVVCRGGGVEFSGPDEVVVLLEAFVELKPVNVSIGFVVLKTVLLTHDTLQTAAHGLVPLAQGIVRFTHSMVQELRVAFEEFVVLTLNGPRSGKLLPPGQ